MANKNKKNKSRRVDFATYKPIKDRAFVPKNMEQLQDSLIARGIGEPQRLAILSNVLHESGGDPKAVGPGNFKGIAQWGADRYPNTEDLGEQIKYLLDTSSNPVDPHWSHGGAGVPAINNLKAGYNSFWNNANPYNATLYYSKGYVRPKEEAARINRAKEADNMAKNIKKDGGRIANKYSLAGVINKMGDAMKNPKEIWGLNKNGMELTTGITNTAMPFVENFITGGNETKVGNAISTIGSALPFPYNLAAKGLGTVVNGLFGSNLNQQNINQEQSETNALLGFQSNASDYDSLSANIANMPVATDFTKSDIGSDGIFSNKASRKFKELQRQRDYAEQFANNTISNNAENIAKNNIALLEANYKAEGGPIFNDFSNGVTQINAGSTHELNPLEGVQIGVDPQGIPNLVEEGEVIFNDYVFSNRLKVPKDIRQKYKLRGITFADAAKELQKESEERPNDPISKKGLNNMMAMLSGEQENIRMKKESNKYAKGGRLANKCSEGDYIITDGIFDFTPDALFRKYLIDRNTSAYNPIAYMPEVPYNKKYNDNSSNMKIKPIQDNLYRKAPIFGSALAVAGDLLGLNKPDYFNANLLENVARNARREIGYRPIGDYLVYTPFDTQNPINQLNAQYGAARRAINNTSGGNRATALAGILASDYNYGNALGDLAIKAQEYNQAQKQKVADFNRATNMTNAEMGLKTDMFNAESLMKQAAMYDNIASLRQKIYDANRAEKIANLSGLFSNLGALGKEDYAKEQLRYSIDKGAYKGLGTQSKCGGKIKRRKKGVTI